MRIFYQYRLPAMLPIYFIILIIWTVSVHGDVQVTIDEEMPPGTVVTRLREHSTLYNSLTPEQIPLMTFDILSQNSAPANYFEVVSGTGVVTVARRMDREDICDPGPRCAVSFNIAIKAGPGASVSFSNVATVEVIINDINDNAPRFPARDVLLEVSEGAKVGTELKISGAVDRDSQPEYTVQYYNTTPTISTFSIRPTTNPDGSSTINLRLEKELDRETTGTYIFNIIAYDGGKNPQSDYLRVTVSVTDENDNSPIFDSLQYELTVNEDELVGAVVGHVTATDKDIGDFGRITYSFSQTSESGVKGVFAINSTTGTIRVTGNLRTIRRSSTPFLMFVDARDGGDPPRGNQTLVSVFIINSGNNAPFVRINTVAAGDTSTLTIPESAPPDYFIAFVDVEDNDDGFNGKVDCQLLSGADFKLNPVPDKGYTLLLNTEVDREEKDSYSVLVSCKDRADSPLETQVSLTVNITDINDHTPEFLQNFYTASVDENRDAGQYITQVKAVDGDIGNNAVITYSVSKEAGDYIRIHPRTGVVSSTASLDREKNATLRFKVFATDSGEPARTGLAEVRIILRDINDNSPVFNKTKFSFFASERTPNNTVIGTITAYDLDTGANGQFDFFGGSITGGMHLPFTVQRNGSVQVSGLLDRETKDEYLFTVLVRDRGSSPRSNTAPVEIKILDENDNEPVILFPTSRNHTIVISTLPENGMVLGRIIAYDMDEGDASALRYFIYAGNDDRAFSMDVTSGELLLQDMKRLQNPQDYHLSIKVEDSSSAPKNATTQLRIEVNFDNATQTSASTQNASDEQYVIIVGVIGGATVVLSLIIISAIFIILRSEKNRPGRGSNSLFRGKIFGGHTVQQSVPNPKQVDNLVAGKPQSDSHVSGDAHGLILRPGNLGKKTEDVQKKVSFRIHDKPQDPHDQGQVLARDQQLHLPPLTEPNVRWTHFSNPDDINSDTSGESGTCDSGRGTSDEDIKFDHTTNKGRPHFAPGDPFLSSRDKSSNKVMSPHLVNSWGVQSTQGQGSISAHHANIPDLKSGRPRFLDTGGGRPEEGRMRNSYHGQRQSPASTSSNVLTSLRQSSPQRGQNSHKDNSINLLRPATGVPHTQQGSAMSIDDDASTTTSGSYVITPDDVILEGFLGKDVIV